MEEAEVEEVWSSPILSLDDDGEESKTGRTEVERGGASQSSKGPRSYVVTLFVDDFKEASSYHHIRGLFSLLRTFSRVFVQLNHKLKRQFCFGFVHFLSGKQASSTIGALGGIRVGGAALSVAPTRFLRLEQQSPIFMLLVFHFRGVLDISELQGWALKKWRWPWGLVEGAVWGINFLYAPSP